MALALQDVPSYQHHLDAAHWNLNDPPDLSLRVELVGWKGLPD